MITVGVREKYNVPAIIFGLILGVFGAIYTVYAVLVFDNPTVRDDPSTFAGSVWEKFESLNDFGIAITETIGGVIFLYFVFTTYLTDKWKEIRSLLLANFFGKFISLILLLFAVYTLYVIGKRAFSLLA